MVLVVKPMLLSLGRKEFFTQESWEIASPQPLWQPTVEALWSGKNVYSQERRARALGWDRPGRTWILTHGLHGLDPLK